jgi:hypothetical protein
MFLLSIVQLVQVGRSLIVDLVVRFVLPAAAQIKVDLFCRQFCPILLAVTIDSVTESGLVW